MKSSTVKSITFSTIFGLFSVGMVANAAAANEVDVLVEVYKIHVKNNAEGPAGDEKGEFRLTLDVNGKTEKISMDGVRDNTTYTLSETVFLKNHPANKPIVVKMNGYESDPKNGDWYDLHRRVYPNPNDDIGRFTRKHSVTNKTYSVWSSTKHFETSYKITIIR